MYIVYIILYIYTYRKAWEMVVDDLLLNIFKCAVLLGLEMLMHFSPNHWEEKQKDR